MRKYLDLMRIDLITMNGEKNNLKSLMLFVFVGSLLGEIFISPMFGLMGTLIIGVMSAPIVIVSHSKYHSEKMFGLLPIVRKDLVTARYIMFTALYLAVSFLIYIFMEVSLAVRVYNSDLEALLANLGLDFNSICRAAFFIFFALGAICVGTSIKGYFSDPSDYEALTGIGMTAKKMKPKQLISALLVFSTMIVILLFMSGVIPLTAGFAVILQLFVQLFTAADGILFSAVMVTLAVFSVIYNYHCTVLEYDDKDI